MPNYATISAGEISIGFDPVSYDGTPSHTTIENRSVTGVIYRVRVKIRKTWKLSFYCTKEEKETIESLNAKNTVSLTEDSGAHTCIMDISSITAISLIDGEELYKVDISLEETGAST